MKTIKPKLYFAVRMAEWGREVVGVASGPFVKEEDAALSAEKLDKSLPDCDQDYYRHVVGWTDDIRIMVEE